jgi:hypothetical protein
MKTLSLCLCLAALAAAACASAPTAPPDVLAADIVAALDAGQRARADELFAPVHGDDAYRERVYPVVFGAARERFARGEPEAAAAQLAFLSQAYPEAASVRTALLYSLFLQRAGQAQADPALVEAIGKALDGVRATTTSPPAWVDLIDAQHAIDAGDLDAAQSSYQRFCATWNRSPPALAVYVDDVGRYLGTHGATGAPASTGGSR